MSVPRFCSSHVLIVMYFSHIIPCMHFIFTQNNMDYLDSLILKYSNSGHIDKFQVGFRQSSYLQFRCRLILGYTDKCNPKTCPTRNRYYQSFFNLLNCYRMQSAPPYFLREPPKITFFFFKSSFYFCFKL